jgi:hypothetical protein
VNLGDWFMWKCTGMIFVCSDIHYIVVCVLLTLIIGYLVLKLKSSFRKFYGRHHGLVNHYGEYLWLSITNWIRMVWFSFMVFNATFNNISVRSWRTVSLVEETGEPGKNHRPVASRWHTLSHNAVHLAYHKTKPNHPYPICYTQFLSHFCQLLYLIELLYDQILLQLPNCLMHNCFPDFLHDFVTYFIT